MKNIIQSLNLFTRIILITFCILSFLIGCQKKETEEEIWERIKEIEALGETKTEKVVDRLINIYKDEDELFAIRHAAAMTLAKLKSKKALETFMQALKEKDVDTQLITVEALGEMKTEKAVEILIELMTHKHFLVQFKAIYEIKKIRPKKAVEPLIEALNDENYIIRLMAAKALGLIKSEKAVSPLTQALKDKDTRVRNAATWALKEIRSEVRKK
jgi:HEAT repeat protein